MEKFKPSKEKKAYSYFGTICKNYLMGQIIKDQKETNRKISYEDISADLENENRADLIYYIDEDILDTDNLIGSYIYELERIIDEPNLSENEKKLGLSLIDIFENYTEIFQSTDNNKFNKNVILLSLREMTNLSTKEIRSSMKKFKRLYVTMLQGIIK
jgi:hypothetical protein